MHSDTTSAESAVMLGVDGGSDMMRNDAKRKSQDRYAQGRAVAQTKFSSNSPYPCVMYSACGCVHVVRVGVWGVCTCVTD